MKIFEKLDGIIKKSNHITPTRQIIELVGDDPYEVVDEIIEEFKPKKSGDEDGPTD